MASHCHHDGGCRRRHHNHRESIPLISVNYATSSPCCFGDCTPCCTQSNQQTDSPPNLDHLLRLIASYLQNQQQQQQQRETQCSCETKSPRFAAVERHSFVNQQHKQQKNVQREYDNLLRKIDDLDLSLNRFSARRDSSYSTLKDSAARVIQTHFRSYLVRRSISLRQLKELASIKSSFLSLKSSVSGKTHFPFEAVSREATDLLLQLDSIQGRVDSMIRDGKRTLCRDLVRFLHYIDDCAVKRREIVCKSAKDVSFRSKCKSSGAKLHVGEGRRTTSEKPKKQIQTIYVTSNGGEEDIAELEEFHFMTDDAQGIPIVSVESSRKLGSSKSRVGALRQGDKAKTPVTKTVKCGENRNVYELTSSAEDDSFDDGDEILMMSRDAEVASDSRSRSRSGVVIKGSGGKTVSFEEDGNVYKVYGYTPEASVSEEYESSTSGSNNEVEDIKYVPKENEDSGEDEEEEVHSENEEESSSECSKEDAQVTENVSHTGRNEHKREFQLRKEDSMFSPPLPLKMEP
ncbi:BAG family molecular chaperone regulator 8, chloroplastic [Eutrema salsugineum]|nr:BAG family molecular chaperone regulator 8, chloroplastic [Eutrema salsugineum]